MLTDVKVGKRVSQSEEKSIQISHKVANVEVIEIEEREGRWVDVKVSIVKVTEIYERKKITNSSKSCIVRCQLTDAKWIVSKF